MFFKETKILPKTHKLYVHCILCFMYKYNTKHTLPIHFHELFKRNEDVHTIIPGIWRNCPRICPRCLYLPKAEGRGQLRTPRANTYMKNPMVVSNLTST